MKFRVKRLDKEKTVVKYRKAKDADGNSVWQSYEQDIVVQANAYGHEDLEVGQVIEITNPHLAAKAKANTEYFEVVDDDGTPRRGRPKKDAA